MQLLSKWFLKLSIRWKLQFSFFFVTMVTILVNRMIGYGELGAVVETAKENNVNDEVIVELSKHLDAYIVDSFWQSGIEFVLLFIVIGVLANLFVAPIKNLCRALEAIEKGDLTVKVKNNSLDEMGTLERSFNTMVGNLTQVICNIDENSRQMAQSSYQIATISHEIAEVSQREQSHSDEVHQAMQTLNEVSTSVRELAEGALQRANKTEQSAQEGIDTVRKSIEVMDKTVNEVNLASTQVKELRESAQQIYNIISTIQGIAEQTNLLALNAAIEAARAGDSGRGFAVVADEVRDLAQRTTNSTLQITNIINEVNAQVGGVATTMEGVVVEVHSSQERARSTAGVIEQMASEVSVSSEANREISTTTHEQSEQFEQMQARLSNLFDTFQQSSAKVETTANIGDDLYNVSKSMKQLLSQFTFERDTLIESSPNEKRRVPRVVAPLRVVVEQGGERYESICSDFSMVGLKLRLNERLDRSLPTVVHIYRPYDELSQYEQQKPIIVEGVLRWQEALSGQDGRIASGLEFSAVSGVQKQQLEACYQYFNKQTHY